MSFKGVKTDGASRNQEFRNQEIEHGILAQVGAEYVGLHHLSADELLTKARDDDALMVLAYPVNRELLEELSRVKVASRYGVDMVDGQAAKSLGIVVAIERACHGGDVPCHGSGPADTPVDGLEGRFGGVRRARPSGRPEALRVRARARPRSHRSAGALSCLRRAGSPWAVIDQAYLARALRDGHLGGAGLDLLEREPATPDEELLHLPNVVITPHVAAYSEEAISMLQERTASAVVDVLSGRRPSHLADPEVWAHRRTVPCTA